MEEVQDSEAVVLEDLVSVKMALLLEVGLEIMQTALIMMETSLAVLVDVAAHLGMVEVLAHLVMVEVHAHSGMVEDHARLARVEVHAHLVMVEVHVDHLQAEGAALRTMVDKQLFDLMLVSFLDKIEVSIHLLPFHTKYGPQLQKIINKNQSI